VNNRLQALRELLKEQDLEALLVTAPSNRIYLSGFTGSAGTLLISQEAALLFTDFRYRLQVASAAPDFELREISASKPLHAAIAEAIKEFRLHCVAYEESHMPVAQYNRLLESCKTLPVGFVGRSGIVEKLREQKDASEIAILRQAIAITDEAFMQVRANLRPEMTERQVAWQLELAMRERGAEGVSFTFIVAAGPNGASPHARSGDAELGVGRPIVIDCGALYQGYHADMTRTLIIGEPDEQFNKIFQTVLEANQRSKAVLRPGLPCREIDAAARDYLTEQGYGEYFGHGLGHGVGLDIHEGPSFSGRNEQLVPVNAIASIEPGIYLPDWGGVRIEDLVLVTDDGYEVLTKTPYDPVVAHA
jgi:Xaa-Pro aminopeptidase